MIKPEPQRIIHEDMPLIFPTVLWAIVLVMFFMMISGCATTQPAHEVKVVGEATALPPQKIPVPIPCLTAEQIPKPPATWMRSTQSREKLEIAAAADLKELDSYMVKSQSLMWGCVKSLEEVKP